MITRKYPTIKEVFFELKKIENKKDIAKNN